LGFVTTLNAQDLTCLSVNDQKVVRQILADREYYKQSYEESERQRTAITASRDSWRALYEAEKYRADNVQGEQVRKLEAALKISQDQMRDDRQKIGELTADNIKLKSSRKWYFILGLGAGAAGGGYLGHKIGNNGTQSPNTLGTVRF